MVDLRAHSIYVVCSVLIDILWYPPVETRFIQKYWRHFSKDDVIIHLQMTVQSEQEFEYIWQVRYRLCYYLDSISQSMLVEEL